MDFFDMSQEVLQVYLEKYPYSAIANNLKACNEFKMYSGKSAQHILQDLNSQSSSQYQFCRELINHNLTVFKNGDGAQQNLPPLVGIIPEAIVNLAIYYLKNEDLDKAFELVNKLEPQTPQEYTIKGTVYAMYGQRKGDDPELLALAQNYFNVIGQSQTECDTVPGRQAMASAFFLLKRFQDVLIYLSSIKIYFSDDDNFNYNYGQAKAAVGKWSDAEDALLRIRSEEIKMDYIYLSTLMKVHIKNKNATKAWKLYLKVDNDHPNSYDLLLQLANESYKTGQFFIAAKAFDIIDRIKSGEDLEYFQAKIGAVVGYFQSFIASFQNGSMKEDDKSKLIETLMLLQNGAENPEVNHVYKVIEDWMMRNELLPDHEEMINWI